MHLPEACSAGSELAPAASEVRIVCRLLSRPLQEPASSVNSTGQPGQMSRGHTVLGLNRLASGTSPEVVTLSGINGVMALEVPGTVHVALWTAGGRGN